MKWSRFNYIFNHTNYGNFIYNSTTNSFVRITDKLYDKIMGTTDWDSGLSTYDPEFKEVLIRHNIVVDDNFDSEYLNKVHFLKYVQAFNSKSLQLVVATTTNCNFRCPYCFEAGIQPISMSKEVEDAIVEFASKRDTVAIVWYGGEPLLNFDSIKRITNLISEKESIKRITYFMITNGYYLTEKVCSFLQNYEFNSIQITLDGNEETHNKSRVSKNGQPSFQRILKNIDHASLAMQNCRFSIRVNISSETKEEYPILYKELKNRWKDRKNILIYLSFIEDYKKCKMTPFASSTKMNFIQELMRKHNIYENVNPSFTNGMCMANQKDSYVVSADGKLYKCLNDLGREHKNVGSILAPDKLQNYKILSEYSFAHDKFSDKKCLDCFLLPVCAGGCPFFRYENKYESGTHDICPYQHEHMDQLLEMMYEHHIARNSNSIKA